MALTAGGLNLQWSSPVYHGTHRTPTPATDGDFINDRHFPRTV
jgi:hypothetical protein